ncbi:MAG: GTP1/OBG family GTP-binding protein [Asgard group archaeon]|nr:GTP1/OBG family GTP-binding protein [Asgard group archaeon]
MSQFKSIPRIPTSDELADIIFSKLKKIRIDAPKSVKKKRSDYSFYKTLYFRQFRTIFPDLDMQLDSIVSNFPIIEELHPFHKELIEVLFGIEKLRTSLSRINNTRRALSSIERDVSRKLGKSESTDEAHKIRQEAIGRIGSTIKKLKEPFDELIEAKIQLSKVPDFNLYEKTIAFAGAPNAGKSSFVKLISTGKPEIASYPFTTKELICGHRKSGFISIQLLDTPGLLDRPLSERNAIEMRSIIALKHLADVIVFLFDPTKEAPLTLEQQLNLFNEIKEIFVEIPFYSFVNKTDVLKEDELTNVYKIIGEYPPIATIEENVNQLEIIIQQIIEKIPDKKQPYQQDFKSQKNDSIKKSKEEGDIEWIFFD